MINIARISPLERAELFKNTAYKMGLPEAIIEKDFWVCYTLDYLFHRSEWKNNLSFKGGTSLSKAYNLINRFSEDIDLILDWRVLGYSLNEPWQERSNTKQDLFNKEANSRAEVFLANVFCPRIKNDLTNELGIEANIYISNEDPQTVIFEYPRIYSNPSTLQIIRLEIGALAAWTPAQIVSISPYASTYYPQVFKNPITKILTVAPERTFWEKITILHQEAHRPEHLSIPSRYSRHYYDLFQMSHSKVKETAFSNLELLKQVVEFKQKFYPRKWAKYDKVLSGNLRIIPPDYRLEALKEDYTQMRDMLYNNIPDFEDIIAQLIDIEKEYNFLYK